MVSVKSPGRRTSQFPRGTRLQVHADCIVVEGVARFAIYDLTRREIILFPHDYYILLRHVQRNSIKAVLASLGSYEAVANATQFINFLLAQQIATLCRDSQPSHVKPIERNYDAPALIDNAIIDIDGALHDFDHIFGELDQVGCRFLEVRCFSKLVSPTVLEDILRAARNRTIESVEAVLRWDDQFTPDVWIRVMESCPLLSKLTIHSAPFTRAYAADFGEAHLTHSIAKQASFVSQVVTSAVHCGTIVPATLNTPTTRNVFELMHFNGCLNRKVSVDAEGNIRNCPSMPTSYGAARRVSLRQIVHSRRFRDVWGVAKDSIDVCRRCEFRYVCSDCRAFLSNPSDPRSKPLKCGYDPTAGEWSNWRELNADNLAIRYYGLDDAS